MRGFLRQKANLWLLAWPAGFLMYCTARADTDIAEKVYAGGVFRAYGTVMSFVSGIFPFSLAEQLLILFPFLIIALLIRGIIRIIRSGRSGSPDIGIVRIVRIAEMFRTLLAVAGVLFLMFMMGAGTNYYRREFADISGLKAYIRESSTEELYEMCLELSQKAGEAGKAADGETAGQYHTDGAAGSVRAFDISMTGQKAREAMESLSERIPVLKGYYNKPKAVFFSEFMSRFNITGVYFPWTVEANINVDVPEYTLGATMCHELSHLRGFMREDEANFIGYLACTGSESSSLQYSGYMMALLYASNRLYGDSRELYRELYSTYTDDMIRDLREYSEYWKKYEDTAFSEAGEKMNNAYLKANNQSDGTKSYGRMVDLLLADYRAKRSD